MILDREVANHNFEVLKDLVAYQKLCVDQDGKLSLDERYLQGIRRTWSRDSREDLIPLIQRTMDECTRKNLEKIGVCATLQKIYDKTYYNYRPVQETLTKIIHKYNCEDGRFPNKDIDVSDLEALDNTQLTGVEYIKELRRNGYISDGAWNLIRKNNNKTQAIIDEIILTQSSGPILEIFDIPMYTVHYCKLAVSNVNVFGTATKLYKEIHYNSLPYITVLLSE
jgi:hypothetical protein